MRCERHIRAPSSSATLLPLTSKSCDAYLQSWRSFDTSALQRPWNQNPGNLDDENPAGLIKRFRRTKKTYNSSLPSMACKCQPTRNVKLESNARAAASRRRQASLLDPRPHARGARHSLALRLRSPATPLPPLCTTTYRYFWRQSSFTRRKPVRQVTTTGVWYPGRAHRYCLRLVGILTTHP